MNHQSVFPAPAASGHRARPLQVAFTNFVTVLENDPRLEGAIRLNEMNGRVHIVKPLGWKREKDGAITDTDINYIRLLIEQTYGLVGEKPAVSVRKSFEKRVSERSLSPISTKSCMRTTPPVR